ncbi:DUF6714 family protein [Roseateles sp. BYS180W]|uniref:DUF6714 family protein n=1 Tax=Roseateles rivi TaxID=3299028 RepID=A0ABW7FR89_9BURK
MKKYPSPKDIEEMRARGYEASTIEKAEQESKRWHLAQAIEAQIREAFFAVQLGQGVGLRQAQGIDGYEEEEELAAYRVSDEKVDWSRIPSSALNECNSSLSFFDAEGMRFHLPAYLLADLSGSYEFGMAFCLTDIGDLRTEQFALLSPKQRDAVRAFLEYISEEDDYLFDRPNILRALAEYWHQ